ncbi:MAG: HAD-IC family P-type ATPase, partial [Oscillospiraceae bacterium]|nr:HAD-IC family P-type ATPase [Oscillospiraceae bacterium]
MHGYTGTLAEQLGRFDCDPAVGLTTRQVEDCRESFGPNAPPPKAQKSHITRFLLAARQPMVAILLLAAAAELLISPARRDVGIIGPVMVILLVFAGLTLILWREDKTTLAVERLRLARAAKAKVIREGVLSIIPAGEIVPGDIAVLSEGDIIPADGRLTRSENLTCDERALTGTIQEKNSEAILPDDTPIGERVNMVFSSCAVTGGCGQFLVTATGGGTEMQTRAAGADDQAVSLIQTEFEEGGKLMAVAGLLAGGVLFLAGLLHGFPPAQLLLAAAAFAVTTLPGGVRAALKLTLARKAEEVSEDGVALRDPSTLETLASVDVILADKAGMLTLERAKLRKIWLAGSGGEDYADQISEPAAHLLLLAALACDGRVELREEEVARTGDSEETAILTAALAHGMTTRELETRYPRVFALPPNRGLTVTVHQVGDHLLAITKGGFEDVLPRCQNAESRSASLANQKMGGGELSVTAVAVRELSILPQDSADLTGELTLIGLLGVYDPPFAQAQEAVVRCRQAGVRTVMLTADSEITARAIAEELGILEEGEQVLTGDALAGMNDQALTQKIGSYSVCARITPKDKHRIVQAWRARGETVAVTGRTGADSPALKAAHLGIALGNEPAGLAAA